MYVSVSNFHFPQMKLVSEKPPEAVLEGVIFLGWYAPRPPYVMVCFARHPSSLIEIWPDRIYFASYGPVMYIMYVCIFICPFVVGLQLNIPLCFNFTLCVCVKIYNEH